MSCVSPDPPPNLPTLKIKLVCLWGDRVEGFDSPPGWCFPIPRTGTSIGGSSLEKKCKKCGTTLIVIRLAKAKFIFCPYYDGGKTPHTKKFIYH
jgi:hypothetical protein